MAWRAVGERGEPGPSGPVGRDGERGERGEAGPAGERGEAGPQGAVGRDGRDGIDGKDGHLSLARVWVEGIAYRTGEIVTHRGGLWQAIEDTNQAPPASSWRLAAAGILSITAFIDEDNPRLLTFAFEGSDGCRTNLEYLVPYPLHRGTWLRDIDYAESDEVAWAGSTWRAIRATKTSPPGDDWRLVAKSGERGRKGETGPMGPQGAPGKDGKDGRTPSVNAVRDLVAADLSKLSDDWITEFEQLVAAA